MTRIPKQELAQKVDPGEENSSTAPARARTRDLSISHVAFKNYVTFKNHVSCKNYVTFTNYGTLRNHVTFKNHDALKGAAHADWLKTDFLQEFLWFYVRLLCSINFCFGPVEIQQFKNNCSGLKIDWGPPMQLFTECVLRHYILLFYTIFG